jgi:two-component SAPR family response regulator
MPARIVVVHDDPVFTDAIAGKLGSDVAWFTDPVRALGALASARSVEFLVTRLEFSNCQPVGLSLARVVRAVRPNVRVIFTGRPEYREHARGVRKFVAEPVSAAHLATVIEWLTESPAAET